MLRRRPHLDLPLPHPHLEAPCGERRRAVDDVTVGKRPFRLVPGGLGGAADGLSPGGRATPSATTRFGLSCCSAVLASPGVHSSGFLLSGVAVWSTPICSPKTRCPPRYAETMPTA